MTKAYYGPAGNTSNTYRLVPAPTISINTEINYSNDVIIGYTYTVTINGYATAMRLLTEGPASQEDQIKSFEKVIDHIDNIRRILSRNGSELLIVDEDDNTMIKCMGGSLRSLNFSESENNWTAYSQYSAQIEFNEVKILDESISCSSGFLDPSSLSPKLIDTNKYKIRDFTDSWSFTIDDGTYNLIKNNDVGNSLNIENMRIGVSYNISATGKNYYIDDQLTPAWVHAKNFVQDRLYNVVTNLIISGIVNTSRILRQSGIESCSPQDTLNNIHRNDNIGILSSLSGAGNTGYKVYNETISCETSESDGTFSANYSSILKKNTTASFAASNVVHTVSKSISTTYDSAAKKNISISIQGNIEGLFEGGVIRTGGSFRLPNSGTLLIGSTLANKYASAESFLSKVVSGDDLTSSYKTALGVTADQLELRTNDCMSNKTLFPSSFNLTKNYMDGTISYSAEYNSTRACVPSGDVASISINVENPVPILAEFNIPGGFSATFGSQDGGVVIQDIGTNSIRKISVSIEGKSLTRKCCINNDIDSILDAACDEVIIPSGIKLPSEDEYILTQKTRQNNLIDGSYSISLGYICSLGCPINNY
jgi:hypothetical protein